MSMREREPCACACYFRDHHQKFVAYGLYLSLSLGKIVGVKGTSTRYAVILINNARCPKNILVHEFAYY